MGSQRVGCWKQPSVSFICMHCGAVIHYAGLTSHQRRVTKDESPNQFQLQPKPQQRPQLFPEAALETFYSATGSWSANEAWAPPVPTRGLSDRLAHLITSPRPGPEPDVPSHWKLTATLQNHRIPQSSVIGGLTSDSAQSSTQVYEVPQKFLLLHALYSYLHYSIRREVERTRWDTAKRQTCFHKLIWLRQVKKEANTSPRSSVMRCTWERPP